MKQDDTTEGEWKYKSLQQKNIFTFKILILISSISTYNFLQLIRFISGITLFSKHVIPLLFLASV